MSKKIFIILFFLIISLPVRSEIIKDVIIEGNSRVSNETILIYGNIKKNEDASEIKINQITKDLYSTDFFSEVNIKFKNSILTINLKEYPVVNQLIIIGEKTKRLKEQIIKIIKTKENRSFIKSYFSNDIELIKTLYSSLGYNFTKVEASTKIIDENNLDLVIEIERGDKTKISKISFLGNNNISDKRLGEIVASEENKFWKFLTKNTNLSENIIKLDIRLLINYYKSLGYYDVDINSNFAEIKDSKNAILVYSIDEGTRYTVNKISINLDSVFDNNLFLPLNKSFDKIIGDYYSPFKIKVLLEDVDELIENNNLQFVEHNVEEILENNSINIVLNIFEGEKDLVERINVIGNSITNEDVIRGELLLDEGDPYTNLALEKSVAELKARNIFKDVSYEVITGTSQNLKIINLKVDEKPTGEISAGAGVGTNGGTVAFNIKENNWLGQGKSVGLDFEVDQETLSGTLSYNDPNYNFLGNSVFYALSSQKNDKPDQGYENSIISTSIGTSFEQYKNVDVNLGLSASYDDLETETTASEALKKQSGNYNEIAGNYGISLDNRDRAFRPTKGTLFNFGQTLPVYADKAFIFNYLGANRYKKFSEDVLGSVKLNLSSITGLGSDDVRISKRQTVSSRRLRGFEKNKVGPVDGTDHIGGNYTATLNFDANLPNFLPEDTKTDINLFLDFGNVWGVDYDSSLDDSNKIRSSTGLAANWISPLGPMSFVFSQNLSKADTDKTEFFNFNLGTTF
tara:strand:- start:1309 stop:3540 length:2232 start_codon:yes stop_codon:yes gene_type:complete